jgi:RNA polymerase sigma factor (sigma-70 family)
MPYAFGVTEERAHQAIHTVFRSEYARLIAGLTRLVRDVALAEELAQDALVRALELWPNEGVPDNPGAWLMTAAKRRGLDELRRRKLTTRKHNELGHTQDQANTPDVEAQLDDEVGDDMLRLVFIACHPVLSTDARVALTLRLLGGLTTEEIARAFLTTEPTVGQRIVRAKQTLSRAQVPFEVPRAAELVARLSAVLEVVYLIFNEGYAATSGGDWVRPALCQDALRLGRTIAELMPDEPEVHGLLALMEIQASRLGARVGPNGEPILLLDQDRSLWDRGSIERGLAALEHGRALGGPGGPYLFQAAIAAHHARAPRADATNWPGIVAEYETLLALSPSPVVRLNHAVAVSMADGPAAALPLVDALVSVRELEGYHLLPSVRADLLFRLERWREAQSELERAASLTKNARERELLLARAAECARKGEKEF